MDHTPEPQKVDQILTVLVGLPGTQETGLVGDVKDIVKHLERLNGQVKTNTVYRKIGTAVSAMFLVSIIGLLVKLFSAGIPAT